MRIQQMLVVRSVRPCIKIIYNNYSRSYQEIASILLIHPPTVGYNIAFSVFRYFRIFVLTKTFVTHHTCRLLCELWRNNPFNVQELLCDSTFSKVEIIINVLHFLTTKVVIRVICNSYTQILYSFLYKLSTVI